MKTFEAIHLNGSFVSGKSSTIGTVHKRIPGLKVWEDFSRPTTFVQERGAPLEDHDYPRARSAGIGTPSDVDALSGQLIGRTARNSLTGHWVIDSHPVTKEESGFRVTAFSAKRFQLLAQDKIWPFYATPKIPLDRIIKKATVHPRIPREDARINFATLASTRRSSSIG